MNMKKIRGPEYVSPAAWKKFTDASIEILAGVILAGATGRSERHIYGSVTIGYDQATVIRLGAAVSLIKEALKSSNGHWLGHAEETQARLSVARKDERFQSFLKGMSDEFTGAAHNVARAKTGNTKATKNGGAA